MSVFSCPNCGFRFESVEAKKCPRCDSTEVAEFKQRGKDDSRPSAPGEVRAHKPTGMVYGDTKGAWRSFHSQQANECPGCGGKEFALDYKRKEKTCKKCGTILALPRRYA